MSRTNLPQIAGAVCALLAILASATVPAENSQPCATMPPQASLDTGGLTPIGEAIGHAEALLLAQESRLTKERSRFSALQTEWRAVSTTTRDACTGTSSPDLAGYLTESGAVLKELETRFGACADAAAKRISTDKARLANMREALQDQVEETNARVGLASLNKDIVRTSQREFVALEQVTNEGQLAQQLLAAKAKSLQDEATAEQQPIAPETLLASLDAEMERLGGTTPKRDPQVVVTATVQEIDTAEEPKPGVLLDEIDAVMAAEFAIAPAPVEVHAAVAEESDKEEGKEETKAAPKKKGAAPSPEVIDDVRTLIKNLKDKPSSPEPNAAAAKPAEAKAKSAPKKVEPAPKMTQPKVVEAKGVSAPAAEKKKEAPKYKGDPLKQPVNIDFREMELANVVALLAQKGQINVIAGTEITGTVTANIRGIPLMQAMELVLRMNGLGIVEEEGIYRVVPYEEAVASRRATRLVFLQNAKAEEVKATLDAVIIGGANGPLVTISANPSTNVLIVAGPEDTVAELEQIAKQLDVAEPMVPTVTRAVKLNYASPTDVQNVVKGMLTKEIGSAEVDERGRHIVVCDTPAVVQQVEQMLKDIDMPVKQVSIDAMIVDAVLSDSSQTGVNWLLNAVRRTNQRGEIVGNLQDLSLESTLGNIGTDALDAGVLGFGILSKDIDFSGAIAAEVQSRNAEIMANPKVVTVENEVAQISIVQEYPYQELTQTTQGPPVASTEFKPIGVTLDVTPRVTHDDDILAKIEAKQSSISGLTEDGLPIEDKREATTNILVEDGRTIFIGGLRNISDRLDISKLPVLGDVPVVNFLFRNTDVEKVNTELLIFLTCNVVEKSLPDLTASQKEREEKIDSVPAVPDSQRAMFRSMRHPEEMRDPAWKWRRKK